MKKPSKGFKKVNVDNLIQLLEDLGWTQEKLAEASGLDVRTIQRYIAGENARLKNIGYLATALKVEVKTLLADDKPSATEPEIEESEKARIAAYREMLKWYQERYESITEELGITHSALANFFEILERQHVPLKDLDAKLREIAAAYKQFQERLQTLEPDNAESARLYAEALAAAERGECDYANTLLDAADRIDSEAREALEARRNEILLNQAATSAAKGDSYKMQLRYGEAAECYRQAVALVEPISEDNEQELTVYLSLLGHHLYDQGDYAGAKLYHERALAIQETVFGPEHPETAASLNNLGRLLHKLGHYARAKPYYERALAIRETVFGPERPETASSLNNLGCLLEAQGDYAGAKLHHERALAIRETVFGPEHPETAASLNNLGRLLEAQGDYAGAKLYHECALAIRETVFGPEHPETAVSLYNLGRLLEAQGDYAGAKLYHERALAIRETVLGPEHPDTIATLNKLASLSRED